MPIGIYSRKLKSHCKRGHARTPDNVNEKGDCKTCTVIRAREYRLKHPKYATEAKRKWRKANPEKARAEWVVQVHGLDKEIVQQYLCERANVTVCDICQQECSSGNNLAIDHDHETGEIRGLLCSHCNTGLGKFKDSVKLLNRAAEYLMEKNRG